VRVIDSKGLFGLAFTMRTRSTKKSAT